MFGKQIGILLLSLAILLLPLSVSAASSPTPILYVGIEITEENADKIWTVEDFEGTGITYIRDQTVFTGMGGIQYHVFGVFTIIPEATMALLYYCYDVDFCEIARHPLPAIPESSRELGENGEIFCTTAIAVLFKEDTYIPKTKEDFPFLDVYLVDCGRNEDLGLTWVVLYSDGDWGIPKTTAAAADMLYDMEGVVFSRPSVWMYSAYGKIEVGDVNFDGTITTTDARQLLIYVAESDLVYLKVGDLNDNGCLDTTDARILLTSVISS